MSVNHNISLSFAQSKSIPLQTQALLGYVSSIINKKDFVTINVNNTDDEWGVSFIYSTTYSQSKYHRVFKPWHWLIRRVVFLLDFSVTLRRYQWPRSPGDTVTKTSWRWNQEERGRSGGNTRRVNVIYKAVRSSLGCSCASLCLLHCCRER